MNVNIFAYSDKGCILALKIAELFPNVNCYAVEKFAKYHKITAVKSTMEKAREVFAYSDLIVFVGACGIAVRAIAPVIKNKIIDPACVVIDDGANFAIPILSGHIGGANDYCKIISAKTGAVPVITTATDINGKFAVDSFAKKNNLFICSMKTAMTFSAEILKRDLSITFGDDVICKDKLPNGITFNKEIDTGVYIGAKKLIPYKTTLHLIPKTLYVGIGCRRNTTKEQIKTLFLKVLDENNLHIKAIKGIYSIDIKKDEVGLHNFCESIKIEPIFFSADELNKVTGVFTSSSFVKSVTGTDNVCERSALLASKNGEILVKKTSLDGVTIAIARGKQEVHFY